MQTSNFIHIPSSKTTRMIAEKVLNKAGNFEKGVAATLDSRFNCVEANVSPNLFYLASLARIIKIKNREDTCAAVLIGKEKLYYSVKNSAYSASIAQQRTDIIKLLNSVLSTEGSASQRALDEIWKQVFARTVHNKEVVCLLENIQAELDKIAVEVTTDTHRNECQNIDADYFWSIEESFQQEVVLA